MRITGGSCRGRVLKTPSGDRVRPTSDKVRQALFNILAGRIDGVVVLDLFAGSGSLGLEALSRGAARATFVEKDRRTLEVIRENVTDLGLADRATLRSFDVLAAPAPLRGIDGPFDIVFLDPPYRLTESVAPGAKLGVLLESLWKDGVIRDHGLAVLEHDRRSAVPRTWENFTVSDVRTYGDTSLSFLTARSTDV